MDTGQRKSTIIIIDTLIIDEGEIDEPSTIAQALHSFAGIRLTVAHDIPLGTKTLEEFMNSILLRSFAIMFQLLFIKINVH